MAVVDAEVWAYTPAGMRRTTDTIGGYVTVSDMERLLEEAHARGFRRGVAEMAEGAKDVALKYFAEKGL